MSSSGDNTGSRGATREERNILSGGDWTPTSLSGLFGSVPSNLPERMQPSIEGGVLGPLVAILRSSVGGVIAALAVGIVSIPLGFAEALEIGSTALLSYITDLIGAFFDPIANADWASTSPWIEALGPVGYIAAIVLVGAGMYAVAEVLVSDG